MPGQRKTAIVAGVGSGTGASLARRFHADGYQVALLARETAFSATLAMELGDAKAYACDVGDAASVDAAMAGIRADMGEARVLLYNASARRFRRCPVDHPGAVRDDLAGHRAWRAAPLAGRHPRDEGGRARARSSLPAPPPRGAAARARPPSPPAKHAQRALAESMARSLWPFGIHIALMVVDGVIDIPRTRKMMPDKPDDFFLKPDAIARIAADLVAQDRSAWSFEVEARPFRESW